MAAIGKKRKCSRMVSWQEKATEFDKRVNLSGYGFDCHDLTSSSNGQLIVFTR